MGGLARRVGYEKALLKQVDGQVAVLQVDCGHIFSDDQAGKTSAEDVRVKNEWVLRAYEQFKLQAANVSQRDLPFLATMMTKADYAANLKQFPMLDRMVSANVVPASDAVVAFKPYVIVDVRSKRAGAKPVRVGILGVSDQQAEKKPVAGYNITDPVEAARKVVPELRKKCDLVIVLAYTDRDLAKKIGLDTTGVDLILAAHQFPLYNTVEEAGDAVVAYVANQTKWIGEMRLYKSSDSKDMAITNYLHRDVPLDSIVPDDPDAIKVVQQARAAFMKMTPAPAPAVTH
ncbi:MAG TPA: hypothetical protein PLF26_04165 [Blastocatellia bacterium]|nr:hypothetical protein [Blastocatellia bacterium]